MPEQVGGNILFESTFHSHKHSVYDFAVRMLGNREAAADVTQEVFIRLYNTLSENHSGINDIPSWLFIVNRNLCLKQIRARKSETDLAAAENIRGNGDSSLNPDHRDLRKAMALLEPGHREALVLREYSGFTYREMAEILEITEAAVKSLLYKARVQLRGLFMKCKAQRERYEVR
jgi:RNA polymerase sigma-70 factor (ECF subfamily)